ncbi:MAG: hypothetical protein AMXMBFR56_72680 [Polyangiaceae bacterium]
MSAKPYTMSEFEASMDAWGWDVEEPLSRETEQRIQATIAALEKAEAEVGRLKEALRSIAADVHLTSGDPDYVLEMQARARALAEG